MRQGFFAIYYTGRAGSGLGLIVLTNGTIVGVDSAGGFYDGIYESNDDVSPLKGNLCLRVPAGTALVTGAVPQPEPTLLNIPLELPGDFATSQKANTIRTNTGPVNVILKKLRDLAVAGPSI
jgi:hypothetical protein